MDAAASVETSRVYILRRPVALGLCVTAATTAATTTTVTSSPLALAYTLY
jgi:hypothetical protein